MLTKNLNNLKLIVFRFWEWWPGPGPRLWSWKSRKFHLSPLPRLLCSYWSIPSNRALLLVERSQRGQQWDSIHPPPLCVPPLLREHGGSAWRLEDLWLGFLGPLQILFPKSTFSLEFLLILTMRGSFGSNPRCCLWSLWREKGACCDLTFDPVVIKKLSKGLI